MLLILGLTPGLISCSSLSTDAKTLAKESCKRFDSIKVPWVQNSIGGGRVQKKWSKPQQLIHDGHHWWRQIKLN